MGVRFTSSFYSTLQNVYWTCELIDVNYPSTGVSQAIELFGEGFEIDYQQQSDERFAAIKGSDCKLNCVITDNQTGVNLLSWINSTINATKEDQYFLNIKKNSEPFWYGVILSDLNTREDESRPFQYVITATDGLKRLSTKPFPYIDIDPDFYTFGRTRFTDLIWNILKFTPLYLTDSSILFSTAVNWYEDAMGDVTNAKDPLLYSATGAVVFSRKEQNQEETPLSCYKALETICEQWGMRIMLSEGYFRLYQVNAYEDEATPKYERLYERTTGGYSGAIDFTGYSVDIFNNNFPYVEAGGQFQWFAPLKNGYLKMPFVQQNMLDETDYLPLVSNVYTYSQTIRNGIVGGISKRLNLTGAINLDIRRKTGTYPSPPGGTYGLTSGYKVRVQIKLKIGIYYLNYDSITRTNSWITNSNARANFYYDNCVSGWQILNYSVITPDLPSGSYNSNEFELKILDKLATDGNIYNTHYMYVAGYSSSSWQTATLQPNTTTGFIALRCIGKTSLKYNSSTSNENEEYFEYIGGNTSTPINSYDIEFNDALFGEVGDTSYPGELFVSEDNTTFLPSLSKWRINAVGTSFDFNILRVREVMSGQFRPCLKYQNSIRGQLLPHNAIEYAGFRMIYNGGTFSAMSDKLNGEWFAVSLDRPSFAEIQGAVAQAGNGGETQFQRQFSEIGGEVQYINSYLENTASGVKVYPASDSITVEYVSGNYFCDTANQTFTMPSAADMLVNGFSSEIYFKNICSDSSHKVYIEAAAGETIDGEESLELKQYHSVVIISDGNNLYLKSTHKPA
jgi:hypothetical protein